MSFSKKVKHELARLDNADSCCNLVELLSLFQAIGIIRKTPDYRYLIAIETENAAIARKIYKLARGILDVQIEVLVRKRVRLRKNNVYAVRMMPSLKDRKTLETLGIIFTSKGGYRIEWKPSILKSRCCHRAYLRGAFLGCGSVGDPRLRTYHLEMNTKDGIYYKVLCELMRNFGLDPKSYLRNGSYLVYLKESEQIVDFLNIIGAHTALLQFEDVRVHKDMRNKINRIVNCETANLGKTVEAAMKQVEMIRLIDCNIGLKHLSPKLADIARLRLDNPDLSLKELGEISSPPLSKSAVNHRMRRLEKLALRITGGNGC